MVVLAVAAVLAGAEVGASGHATLSSAGLAVAVARLAVDALGAVQIGLTLLPLLIGGCGHGWPAEHGAAARARRAALGRAARYAALVAAGWTVAALLALWMQAADAAGSTLFQLRPEVFVDYATQVAAGRGLLLTLSCALLVAGLMVAAANRLGPSSGQDTPRYPELAVGASVLGVLPGPVTGHASSDVNHDYAVLAIALHVVAACVWVGGLVAVVLVLAGHRGLLAVVLPRFSVVAGYCAGVVAVTGVLSAVFRLPAPSALVDTGYGALVLAKAAGLVGLLALGWRARGRLLRRVVRPTGRSRPELVQRPVPLVQWLSLELAVMAVVFGLAPALAGSAPA